VYRRYQLLFAGVAACIAMFLLVELRPTSAQTSKGTESKTKNADKLQRPVEDRYVSYRIVGLRIQPSDKPRVPNPIEYVEYKNSHYIQPPVPAGDGGAQVRVGFSAPGEITKVTLLRVEGKGCAWTHECPDGAQCVEPYRHPVDYYGATAAWNGWSNSGANCALFFHVAWK
jgi:hypothetical protein